MPFNGSGGTSQPTSSVYPASANTLIESAKFNITIADIYSMLGSCIVKDGQTATTAEISFASGIATDTIAEDSAGTGVTIDGVLLKDSTAEVTEIRDTSGNEAIKVTATASAVNEVTIANAATGTGPTISATGDDTNIDLVLASKGSGHVTAADDDFAIKGSADGTKRVRFEVDGLTTGNTRVLTVQDSDDTIVGRATTDTLTNKTITASTNTVAACTLATEQAATSGTAIDFTSIPSWVKKITIQFVAVSTDGTANPYIQVGDAGGIEDSGYLGASSALSDSAAVTAANYTAAFGIASASAARALHGTITLTLEDSAAFTWVASGIIADSSAAATFTVAGSKSLSAALDRIRITTSNGTDAFDAGAINLLYE